jgi:hypothetical protein
LRDKTHEDQKVPETLPKTKKITTITLEVLRGLKPKPCYDPSRHLLESWSGTIMDILEHSSIPAQDKIWVACHEELVDAKTLRLFAVWNARRVLTYCKNPNPLIAKTIDTAERYANGECTMDELQAVQKELDAADWAADLAAYWAAYWAADRAADRAAYLGADRAAYLGADLGADLAADWAADLAADWAGQVEHLIQMIKESGESNG